MQVEAQKFEVRLASDDAEVRAAQRLRYEVFVEEMGAKASPEDHAERLERDAFDPHFDHLLLIDRTRAAQGINRGVVGVYRLMRGSVAAAGAGFYGQHEYDLSKLTALGRETVELGRSCVHADYRGGAAMHLLWSGLGEYVIGHGVEIMFGVASFHGTDVEELAQPLSLLHHQHLAPEELRVRTLPEHFVPMDRLRAEEVDHKAAMRAIPPLIKAYLRLGGFVGEGAFIDWEFNTVDVCLLMDTTRMADRYREMYSRRARSVQA
ncbi:GNAT family N-acetyltransferase [Pontivivens ytuae]|uniref:L-ornithine N(alpha)-acyltransferase n=1 Tax=Pontivivens ytuae TaxID=2789856 RepID=A0A7S9QE45_9RHOB|nr:GNAT family N-acyltransferase [Pontivivens ytuae]QPH55012.1 GNAT family N-acetyltransferase [Pontivivens ytuae]